MLLCYPLMSYWAQLKSTFKHMPSISCDPQIAERSAQLHEALLHCGRFQDALESLLSWLTDTEELMANQKPPSAEFKVVKAQIQEQKVSWHRVAQTHKHIL